MRALTDPAARARAVAGMARARAELTWERTAQMTLDLYERALAGASGCTPRPRLPGPNGRRRSRASRGTLRCMRLRPGLLALLLCVLALPAPRRGRSPPGTLAQLAGAGGCVSQQTPLGCTPAHGLDDARAVALSPDGTSLYVACGDARQRDGVQRRSRNGLLAQLNLGGRLPRLDRSGPAAAARARSRAPRRSPSRPTASTSTSPSAAAGAVASFARQPNGSLVQLTGIAGCIAATPTPGCDDAHALAGADAIAISPDGRFVYVGAATADAIIVFSRDAASGRLTPLAGHRGLPARQPRHLHARHGHRRALGDRHLARRDIALRHLDRRHADLVPARRDDRNAHSAADRIRLPERRRLQRLHADRRARTRIGRRRLARRHHRRRGGNRRATPC